VFAAVRKNVCFIDPQLGWRADVAVAIDDHLMSP
jgi:hypothetical protein